MIAFIIVAGLVALCIILYAQHTGQLLSKSKVKDRDESEFKLR